MTDKKLLIVALAGEPNVGKSTLFNTLVGVDLAIVTHKAQTTRKNLMGIHNIKDTQLLFVDTPGIFEPNNKSQLEQYIVKNAWSGVNESDIIMVILDATKIYRLCNQKIDNVDKYTSTHDEYKTKIHKIIGKIRKRGKKIVILINKIDLLENNILEKNNILENNAHVTTIISTIPTSVGNGITGNTTTYKAAIAEVEEEIKKLVGQDLMNSVTEIFKISAKAGNGINVLMRFMVDNAQSGEWLYGDDICTNSTDKEIAQEITREQIYLKLNQELPYSIKVENEMWNEQKDGSVKVHQVIFVLKDSQKKIVLGVNGNMIKNIGTEARKKISKILGRKIHLFLHVKVKENWTSLKI